MKKLFTLITTLVAIFLLTGCFGEKVIYLDKKCPYVEPLNMKLRKNKDGSLNKFYTQKAYAGLTYYGVETRRVKKTILDREKDN